MLKKKIFSSESSSKVLILANACSQWSNNKILQGQDDRSIDAVSGEIYCLVHEGTRICDTDHGNQWSSVGER